MYVPPRFKVEDQNTINSFIKENAFGLLISTDGDVIHDTQTPLHLKADGTIYGHIARANPQWKSWTQNSKVKVVFSGPHSYISPKYYESEFNVPTWNYSAVSVTGDIKIIDSQDEVLDFLDALVQDNEGSEDPWALDRSDDRYIQLLSGFVVFQITPTDIQASFKMNQNKSFEDKSKVIDSLKHSGCPFDHQTSEFMAQANKL
ncbi:FMN-binding negative transcriptional regulator [Rubritalea spongiae]|uniref:FMN-binding negative transcriptional regulator n=1 Tax=Rubritalea spongiae TaxID=430797 RepID=A0ABW5E0E1_9BACT